MACRDFALTWAVPGTCDTSLRRSGIANPRIIRSLSALKRMLSNLRKCLAGTVGFEPTICATKKRCPTTRPRPNWSILHFSKSDIRIHPTLGEILFQVRCKLLWRVDTMLTMTLQAPKWEKYPTICSILLMRPGLASRLHSYLSVRLRSCAPIPDRWMLPRSRPYHLYLAR